MRKRFLKLFIVIGLIMGGAIVLIPLESHAEDVTVTVTVQSTISLSLSGTPSATDVLPNSKVEGTDSSFYTLASVTTNSTAGYTLTVIDKDTDNSLKAGSHSIPATASNSLTAGTAAWGYRVSGDTDWLAMPKSDGYDAPIAESNTYSASAQNTTIQYGVATAAGQAAGSYTDVITYTATAKT